MRWDGAEQRWGEAEQWRDRQIQRGRAVEELGEGADTDAWSWVGVQTGVADAVVTGGTGDELAPPSPSTLGARWSASPPP